MEAGEDNLYLPLISHFAHTCHPINEHFLKAEGHKNNCLQKSMNLITQSHLNTHMLVYMLAFFLSPPPPPPPFLIPQMMSCSSTENPDTL